MDKFLDRNNKSFKVVKEASCLIFSRKNDLIPHILNLLFYPNTLYFRYFSRYERKMLK